MTPDAYRRPYPNADAFLEDRRDFLEVHTIEAQMGGYDIFMKLDGGYSVREEAEAVAETFVTDVRHLLAKTKARAEPSAISARDPEWIIAEIQAASDPMRAVHEIAQLWSPAADRFINLIVDRPELPQLVWSRILDDDDDPSVWSPRLLGSANFEDHADAVAVAQQWVTVLGLEDQRVTSEYREWSAIVGGWCIEIIADVRPGGAA